MSRLLDFAFELMDEGRGAQAEAMLLEAVERTRRNHGEASDEHAEALEDASSFFTRLKQLKYLSASGQIDDRFFWKY